MCAMKILVRSKVVPRYSRPLLPLWDAEGFYFFKGEAMEQISDDELIEFMKRDFDGKCQGSIEYLSGTSLEELCRGTRYGLNGLE